MKPELIPGEDSSPSPHETMSEMGSYGGRSAAAMSERTGMGERRSGSRGEEEDDPTDCFKPLS